MTITRSTVAGSAVAFALLAIPLVTSAAATPTVNITASKTSISASKSPVYANLPTISWSSTNASSCAASGSGWSGAVATSGSQKVNPPVTTTYTLTCTGAGGSANQSVTVTVTASQTASALSGLTQATSGSAPQAAGFSHTWNADLQLGSSGPDVSALQTALSLNGVYTGDVTGGFYSQTFAAVKAFQTKYGINATGYVGPATRAKLNALY